MRSIILSFILLISLILSNCAGVKVYSDPNLKHKAAIKVYLPKPFLLVERNPTKDVAFKANIIFLPDLAEPVYIMAKNGLGTSNLTLNLEKGYLSQYGAVTDSKIPETITAVSGLATALMPLINLADAAATGDTKLQAGDTTKVKELKKIEIELKNIKIDLDTAPTTELTTNKAPLKDTLSKELEKAINTVNEYNPVRNPELYKQLEVCMKLFETLILIEPQSEAGKRHNQRYGELKSELEAVIKKIKPEEPPLPAFELFEIIYNNKQYSLKRVNI